MTIGADSYPDHKSPSWPILERLRGHPDTAGKRVAGASGVCWGFSPPIIFNDILDAGDKLTLMRTYFLWVEDRRQGPFTIGQINELMATGKANHQTKAIDSSVFQSEKQWENKWLPLAEALAAAETIDDVASQRGQAISFQCVSCSSLVAVDLAQIQGGAVCPRCQDGYSIREQMLSPRVFLVIPHQKHSSAPDASLIHAGPKESASRLAIGFPPTNWLGKKIGEWATNTQREEMGKFVDLLKGMDGEEIGMLVAVATHMRHELESEGHHLLDPIIYTSQNPKICALLNGLIGSLQKEGKTPDAAALMVWLHTSRAGQTAELRSLGRAIWGELQRGFIHASSAAKSFEALAGVRLNTSGFDSFPIGLTPVPT